MKTLILMLDGDEIDVTEEADLETALRHLQELGEDGMAEACLSTFTDGQAGPSLTALVHGARGWLMFLGFDGDAGYSTRNPAYSGDPKATVAYTLSNGQVDEYPASWVYPTKVLPSAFVEFFRTGARPTGFEWFDDSAD